MVGRRSRWAMVRSGRQGDWVPSFILPLSLWLKEDKALLLTLCGLVNLNKILPEAEGWQEESEQEWNEPGRSFVKIRPIHLQLWWLGLAASQLQRISSFSLPEGPWNEFSRKQQSNSQPNTWSSPSWPSRLWFPISHLFSDTECSKDPLLRGDPHP